MTRNGVLSPSDRTHAEQRVTLTRLYARRVVTAAAALPPDHDNRRRRGGPLEARLLATTTGRPSPWECRPRARAARPASGPRAPSIRGRLGRVFFFHTIFSTSCSWDDVDDDVSCGRRYDAMVSVVTGKNYCEK